MAKKQFQKPKGTADILPGKSEIWQRIENVARLLFSDYGFAEIRTPIFESFDIFARSAGDTSDVVTKEMYDFYDKGDRHVALRPEGTAGVVRSYVEEKLYGPEHEKPVKLYYIGPMFRYERPQAGRFRQFHQIGVEAFGSNSPALDVEIIAMAIDFFTVLGLKNLKVKINSLGDQESRDNYRNALIDYLSPFKDQLSADSKERLDKNPLRVLDSKDERDQEIVQNAPIILDYLSENSKKHFEKVQKMLDALNIEYMIDATVVRGLDYYNDTIFEIVTDDDSLKGSSTIAGGGRYSGLVSEVGGPETDGIGFGIGFERLVSLLMAQDVEVEDNSLDFYLVNLDESSEVMAMQILQVIRSYGYKADRDYLNRSAKAQFKSANKKQASYVVTIGQNEVENNVVQLKDMQNSIQKTIKMTDIINDLPNVIEEFKSEE